MFFFSVEMKFPMHVMLSEFGDPSKTVISLIFVYITTSCTTLVVLLLA